MTTLNLAKLNSVQTGGNVFDILTADRINAIQDAIKYLAAGRNIHAGQGVDLQKTGQGVHINTAKALHDTKYRQIQEWNYIDGAISKQAIYNGATKQPYDATHGLHINLPRVNNEWDDCEDPLPPINVWSSMGNTYTSGQNYLEDRGAYFVFNEPGVYELTFDVTAMHKTGSCEAAKNTHSFDIMAFPAIGNKGVVPSWDSGEWDWVGGRSDFRGQELRVIHPANGFAMFTIHGKQRVPNDGNAYFEFYDKRKKFGITGVAGIKYRPNTSCSYSRASSDTCGIVRGLGQSSSSLCLSSSITIPSLSLSSYINSYAVVTDCGTPSTEPLVYINDVGSTTSSITYVTEVSGQSSGINFVNETYCDTSTLNYIATIDSATTSLYQVNQLVYTKSTISYVSSTSCETGTINYVEDVVDANTLLSIPTLTEGTHSVTSCCYFSFACCNPEEGSS